MERPLRGARVVEIGGSIAVAAATKLLSDYGADVIKVELPRGADMRRLPPFPGDVPDIEQGAYHVALDTGKRSLVVDVDTPSGREVIGRLAARADVFVLHVAPDLNERLRAAITGGADAASALAPSVVSLAEHGLEGPFAGRVENDMTLFAWSSRMRQHGIAGEAPARYAPQLPVIQWGATAGAAVLAVLWGREQGGGARHMEVAGVEALLSNVDNWFLIWQFRGNEFGREPGRASLVYPSGCFRCRDGYVVVSTSGEVFFQRVCAAIGHPELLEDPRFATPAERVNHKAEFMEFFLPWIESRTRHEAFTGLQEHGVMVAPLLEMNEVAEDPQAVARGSFVEAPMPRGGATTLAGPPFRMEDAWAAGAAPLLGAHTAEVLGEAGYGTDEQIALFRAGVTG